MKKITLFVVVFISFCLSLVVGMMDYETESLWHLLTSDKGNIVFLSVLTGFFALIGVGLVLFIKYIFNKE